MRIDADSGSTVGKYESVNLNVDFYLKYVRTFLFLLKVTQNLWVKLI